MNRLTSIVAGGSLIACVSALAGNTSVMMSARPAHEQYCFPRFGGPFSADSVWPSVTMIYEGVTLTTTPIAAIGCETVPSNASFAPIMVTSPPLNPSITLNQNSQVPGISSSATPTSDSLPNGSSDDVMVSQNASSDSLGARPTTGSLGAVERLSSANFDAGTPTLASVSAADNSAIRSDMSRSPTTADAPMPSTTLLNQGKASGTSSMVGATAGNSNVSGGVGDSGAASSGQPFTATVSGAFPKATNGQAMTTASVVPSTSSKLPGSPSLDTFNATFKLSPAAVNALQLAQFLKNLGVSVFNASSSSTRQSTNASLLADVVANISTQEYTQHKTIERMLRRTGDANIPPCKYLLPNNATDMDSLMSVLKSIEVGAFMSLAESLPPEDTPAAILLSSMASVAARQNAMLDACTRPNTSMASFETPLSATWAYNLALNYVQPGSCMVELPIPILPTLSIGNRITGHARSNDSVTFTWDTAAGAAAARSGKPLFIGWVNQVDVPAYTSLDTLGDGSGKTSVPPQLSGTAFAVLTAQPGLTEINDLTEATLAGPVMVSLM